MSTDPLRGDSAAEQNLKDLREAITSLLGLVSNLPALTPRPLTVEERETLERLDKRVIVLLDVLGMRRPEVRQVLIDPLRRYGMTQIAAYLPWRHPPGVGPDELIVIPDQFGGWENDLRAKLEEIEIRLRSFPDRHSPPNAATSTTPAAGPGGAEGADRSGTDGEQSEEPGTSETLNKRERDLLVAYLALNATSKRRSKSLTAAAVRADPGSPVDSYKRANARLTKLGFLEKLSPQEGKRMYLSEQGKARAEQEKQQQRG